VRDYCLDKRFSPMFKEAWCKRADPREALEKYQLRAPRDKVIITRRSRVVMMTPRRRQLM
jgi:hypothetical protein